MKKTFSRILSCLLAGITISFAGCSSNEAPQKQDYIVITDENRASVEYAQAKTWDYKPAVTYSYANLGDDVMPIVGMWGPWDTDIVYGGERIPNLATDEMYSQVAETGVNVLWQGNQDYNKYPQKVMNALDFCAKNKMVYIVRDTAIVSWGSRSAREDTAVIYLEQDQLTNRIATYAKHAGFGGIQLEDEPSPFIAPTFTNLCSMYNKSLQDLNLSATPVWWNAAPMGYFVRTFGYDYETHLKELGSAAGVICFDMYPFEWNQPDDFNFNFFTNLNMAAKAAEEQNLPWQAYVATGGNWTGITDDHTGVKPATIEQLVWQVNTIIAYGAKGIQYYTVNQPISSISYLENGGSLGMFDSFGNKTQYFYAAKMANSQIHACEKVLMNATQHGVISTGYIVGKGQSSAFRKLIPERQFRELTSVSENSPSFIGCFDYLGKTMLYVVNSSYTENSKVTLGFDNTYCFEVTQRAEKVEIAGKQFTLNLAPGESAMVVLK